MPGGEIQLVALGAHDLYLSDNPQISFFKAVYKRYTYFAQELINLQDNDNSNNTFSSFGESKTFKFSIPRNGDLLKEIYLEFTLPAIYSSDDQQFQWIRRIGEYLIREARIIGADSRVYQRISGEYLHIYAETHLPAAKKPVYYRMTGNIPELYDPANAPGNNTNGFYPARQLPTNGGTTGIPSIRQTRIFICIPFWFSTHPGTALPLISLQKMEMRLEVDIRPLNEIYTVLDTNPQSSTFQTRIRPVTSDQYLSVFTNEAIGSALPRTVMQAWGNYMFLEREERKRFAQTEQKYLMHQYQYYTNNKSFGVDGSGTFDIDLKSVNLPITQFFFMVRRADNEQTNQWSNFTSWEFVGDKLVNPLYTANFISQYNNNFIITDFNNVSQAYNTPDILSTAELKLNGNSRFHETPVEFFDLFRDYYNLFGSAPDTCRGIYGYSFALDNGKFQPSGTCNFSMIGKKDLLIKFKNLTQNAARDASRGLPFNNSYSVILIADNINFFYVMGGLADVEFSN